MNSQEIGPLPIFQQHPLIFWVSFPRLVIRLAAFLKRLVARTMYLYELFIYPTRPIAPAVLHTFLR